MAESGERGEGKAKKEKRRRKSEEGKAKSIIGDAHSLLRISAEPTPANPAKRLLENKQ